MKLRKDRPVTPEPETMAQSVPTEEKKRRMSSLFGRKKDKNGNVTPPAVVVNGSDVPQTPAHDSAYASSEPTASITSSTNTVPIENHGQISGVNQDRNLAYNKTTGDVLDDDTGEIVSTVTTTTTTTTTTTMKGGGKRESKVDVVTTPTSSLTASRPANHSRENSSISEMPADTVHLRPETNTTTPVATTPPESFDTLAAPAPSVPYRNPGRRSRDFEHPYKSIPEIDEPVSPVASLGGGWGRTGSIAGVADAPPPVPDIPPPMTPVMSATAGPEFPAPNPPDLPARPAPEVPPQVAACIAHHSASHHPPTSPTVSQPGSPPPPPPPLRPRERSIPRKPISTNGLNSTADWPLSPDPMPAQHQTSMPHYQPVPAQHQPLTPQPSLSQNLKAAAKGLHGIGESLRGTLNNEIDTRYPRKNPEKAAAANAKNQAAINTGASEIQGLNYRRS